MLRVLTCFVLLALFGCSTDPTSSSTSNGDSSGSTSTESGDSGTSDTGNPQACMDIDGCADDEWCDFPDDHCGAGEPGTCTPKPSECGNDEVSVCGCDGMTYSLACVTVVGGVDKNLDASACTPPPDYFPCGDLLCDSGSFYCRAEFSDVGGEPNTYACVPLPDACGTPVDCACLMAESCGEWCEATGAGFTLSCPGG